MKVFVKSGVVIAKGNATDKTPRGEWVVAPAGTKIGDLYRKSDGTFRSPIYTITAKRFWRRWTTAERELLANKLRHGHRSTARSPQCVPDLCRVRRDQSRRHLHRKPARLVDDDGPGARRWTSHRDPGEHGMSTYVVTRKADGVEVYRYESDAAIPWDGMGFATHDHTVLEPPPPPPPPPVNPIKITKLAFRQRFTVTERVAIEMAAIDDPGQDMSERAQAAALRVYLGDVEAAAALQASEDYRREERRRSTAQEDIANEAQTLDRAARMDAAAARLAGDGLRSRASALAERCPAASHTAAADAGAPTASAGAVLADVLGRLDVVAGDLAAALDSASIAGQACERAYTSLTPGS